MTVGQVSFAADNVLNAVLLKKIDSTYDIVLRSDYRSKVSKKVKSDNEIDITLKNISAGADIPILYRNVPSDSSVVISDKGKGEVKLHITSKGISKSNVVFETPNSAPITVNTNYSFYFVLAALSAIFALMYATKISAKKVNPGVSFDLNIKDREIKLLKKYREELTTIPSINYNMKNCGYPRHRISESEEIHYSRKA